MNNVIIFGSSHTTALKKGYSELAQKNDRNVEILPMMPARYEEMRFSGIRRKTVVPLIPVLQERLESRTGLTSFDKNFIWGVCMGTFTTRIYNQRGFWVSAEPSAIAEQGKRPISDGIIKTIIERSQKHVRIFAEQMNKTGGRLFVISGPHPRSDHDCILSGVRRETVRYIDCTARRMFENWLQDQEIDFISPPPATFTEDGFLKVEFNAPPLKTGIKDQTHANDEYGELMMKRVLRFLDGGKLDG